MIINHPYWWRQKGFEKDATHLFQPVVGALRQGRLGRRREFIDCYDKLLEGCDNKNKSLFGEIVHAIGDFMDLNNEMMMAVRQSGSLSGGTNMSRSQWLWSFLTCCKIIFRPSNQFKRAYI